MRREPTSKDSFVDMGGEKRQPARGSTLVGMDLGYAPPVPRAFDERLPVVTDRAIARALGVSRSFVKRTCEAGVVSAWSGGAPTYAWRAYDAGWTPLRAVLRVAPVRWWIARTDVVVLQKLVTKSDLRGRDSRHDADLVSAAVARRSRRQSNNLKIKGSFRG